MRQLRLKGEDLKYAFLCQGMFSEKDMENLRKRLSLQSESLRAHSFMEEPLWINEGAALFKAGFVPCREETIISLPDQGSVYVAGSKGGFIVAAQCENKEIR